MRTIAPCTRFARRDIVFVCIACMSASSVKRRPSGRWWPQAPAAVPARMHCTSPSLPASSNLSRAWSLRAAGLVLDQPFWVDLW